MYSKIPMPRVEWNEKNMKYAMCFFPLVGAVIGGLMLLVRFLCGRFGFNTSVYAVVMTALPVLVSGGIHTDGFIDTVDALSSYGDKEKKLEILKDPHTGAFAIIGAVMYYLLFFGFMTEIWDIKATIAVSVGFVLSRSLSGLAIGIFKCAKNSGLLYTFKSAAHKKTINIAANSPYYKEVFSKNGITGDSIQSLDDIRKIPFTTKSDMRANYPFGLVAGDMKRDGVRIHSSSGTTGNPTVIVHSQHDLDSWANLVARCLYMVGIRKTDVFQNSSGYGMFTGGLGFQYGAERLGCLTVPAAAGNSKRQIKFISDFKTTALHAIPSYAIRLAEVFQEEGIDPRETTLKTLVIGAEPHTDEQRRKIERMLNVKAYNSFGMTEMNGPGVAFECQEQNGMHFWEDCYLVEIIDPETGEPVPEGEIGELVLTTLDREMMPLIRYRTRDLTRILPGKCPCGRTHLRIDRIKGRSDDMFIIKGVNIFPMQVEKILVQFPELGSNYLITLETVNNQDEMIVEVELSDLSTDNYIELEKIRRDIIRQLKDEILVTPKVKLVKKGSLPQSEGKAVRVKDLRDNK